LAINAAGTQGFVGFLDAKKMEFGDVTIQTENEYPVILITRLERNEGIGNSQKVLVTAIARAKNTDMGFKADHTKLLETG